STRLLFSVTIPSAFPTDYYYDRASKYVPSNAIDSHSIVIISVILLCSIAQHVLRSKIRLFQIKMQIIYPEISGKDEDIKKVAFDDNTLDLISEKDLERSLQRTKSLKEASYLENEDNEKLEANKLKKCVLHLRENCCQKLQQKQQEPKKCCITRLTNLPCVQMILNRTAPVAAKAE
ncbi:hypothetical protein PENTCL1PPCAC_27792, partial [Pristionchus entomophagus]